MRLSQSLRRTRTATACLLGGEGAPAFRCPTRQCANSPPPVGSTSACQLVTSYGVQRLELPAAEAGGALAEMFDDYEPGITWPQVGLNDGTIMQERGPRILNPFKQGHDLDPTETYVRQWLPELGTVPPGFAHEPWNWLDNPLLAPIVDHKAAFREARAMGKPKTGSPAAVRCTVHTRLKRPSEVASQI